MIKQIVKIITPPCLFNAARRIKYCNPIAPQPFYGVRGGFSSWQEALDYCEKSHHKGGYEASDILDKVSAAIQEVRKGNAEFERDSFLFYKKEYNYQFLSALFYALNKYDGSSPIQVVDFGGSLGSVYFQNQSLLSSLGKQVSWNVIEQKHFVDRGRAEVPEVNFYYSIEELVANKVECDILLMSGVMEYLPEPYKILGDLLKMPWRFIIIDRSLFHPVDEDMIGVQTVPPSIYDAQYPIWVLSSKKLEREMQGKGYEMVYNWETPWAMSYIKKNGGGKNISLIGAFFMKK